MDFNFQLLKELSSAHGIPGYQAPKRGILCKYQNPLGDLPQDKIGSVICQNNGTSEAPRVMLAKLMDEDHFLAEQITKEGFMRKKPELRPACDGVLH
jgi:putative aminopeptidase FrvX